MKKVLVFGVFNILHPGHLRLLRFAKECGDFLCVAVQSEKALDCTPLISEDDRLRGVLSNTYVDEAFITRETLKDLIVRIKPDVVVKGKEHELSDKNEERETLEEYGGELLFDSGDNIFSSLDMLRSRPDGVHRNCMQLPLDYIKRNKIDLRRLIECLHNFSKLKVLVIGDLIIDEYITCDPIGMSQEEPTIVVAPVDKQVFIGGAGIVAAHASSLGAQTSFISVTGKDKAREKAEKILKNFGVDFNLIIDEHRPTTRKRRYRSKGKTLLRTNHLHQSCISKDLQKKLIDKFKDIVSDVDLIVFSDFNYGVVTDSIIKQVTKIAKKNDILIVADSQSSSQIGDISRFVDMDFITPTEREARLAMNDFDSGIVVLIDKLCKKINTKNALLKLGEEGVLIHTYNDSKIITDRLNALNINPKDVAGAGDSMLISSSMALCLGLTMHESILIGSIAACIQVGSVGNTPLQVNDLSLCLVQ